MSTGVTLNMGIKSPIHNLKYHPACQFPPHCVTPWKQIARNRGININPEGTILGAEVEINSLEKKEKETGAVQYSEWM